MLKRRRIDTQVVRAIDLSEELFADKHLIIAGADRFRVRGSESDDVIRSTNLPILAMREGGYKLLGELHLSLGDLQVTRGATTSVRPVKLAIFIDTELPLSICLVPAVTDRLKCNASLCYRPALSVHGRSERFPIPR